MDSRSQSLDQINGLENGGGRTEDAYVERYYEREIYGRHDDDSSYGHYGVKKTAYDPRNDMVAYNPSQSNSKFNPRVPPINLSSQMNNHKNSPVGASRSTSKASVSSKFNSLDERSDLTHDSSQPPQHGKVLSIKPISPVAELKRQQTPHSAISTLSDDPTRFTPSSQNQLLANANYPGSNDERASTSDGSINALYELDPHILQSFADALTPHKSREITDLRNMLEEMKSEMKSSRGELMALRSERNDLASSKAQLEKQVDELKTKLAIKSSELHDFNNHKHELNEYMRRHIEFFGNVQTTIKGLFVQETRYEETMNTLANESETRQRLDEKIADLSHEHQQIRAKYKSQEQLLERTKGELEAARAELNQLKQVVKEYENVTELSRMKNELRKMKENSMNLKNIQNVLQTQRMKFFETQKDYKTLQEEHGKLKDLLGQTSAKNEELRVKLAREMESRDRDTPSKREIKSRKIEAANAYADSQLDKRMVGMEQMPTQVQPRSNPMSPPTGAVPMTTQHVAVAEKKKEPTIQDLKAKQLKHFHKKLKEMDNLARMKKNGVVLNAEQESLLAAADKIRAKISMLQS